MKKIVFKISSGLALLICLALAWLNFTGWITRPSFKLFFLMASLAYFILATISVSRNPSV